jgi:hypothetical protein
MVGAALSREYIAHECAPAEISNMIGGMHQAKFHPGYWSFVDKEIKKFPGRERETSDNLEHFSIDTMKML